MQLSSWGRESWLIYFNCIQAVVWVSVYCVFARGTMSSCVVIVAFLVILASFILQTWNSLNGIMLFAIANKSMNFNAFKHKNDSAIYLNLFKNICQWEFNFNTHHAA